MHQAMQAGKGGAGKLTNKSPEQALWELALGGASVTLAAADVGLGAKQMMALSRTAQELSQSGVTLSQGQWHDGLKSAQEGDGALERFITGLKDTSAAVKDKIRRALKGNRDPQTEIVGVPGQSSVKTTQQNVEDAKKALQSRGAATTASGKVNKPNPNVSPEIAAKWSKTKNWDEVEPLIGQQAGGQLPPEYEYKTLNRGTPEERTIIARISGKGNDVDAVPLQIAENGTLQVTTNLSKRISNPLAMRKNFEAAYKKLEPGYWIHHLVPDEVVRNNALAKFARSLGYDLDESSNLIGLANKEQWAKGAKSPGKGYSDAVGHWSGHDQYSKQVNQYLNDEARRLEKKFGDLNQALKDPKQKKQLIKEVNQVMQDAENEFRSLIEKGNVPKKDGRLAWDNEQTEPTA